MFQVESAKLDSQSARKCMEVVGSISTGLPREWCVVRGSGGGACCVVGSMSTAVSREYAVDGEAVRAGIWVAGCYDRVSLVTRVVR
jgi:hypothetical protein